MKNYMAVFVYTANDIEIGISAAHVRLKEKTYNAIKNVAEEIAKKQNYKTVTILNLMEMDEEYDDETD